VCFISVKWHCAASTIDYNYCHLLIASVICFCWFHWRLCIQVLVCVILTGDVQVVAEPSGLSDSDLDLDFNMTFQTVRQSFAVSDFANLDLNLYSALDAAVPMGEFCPDWATLTKTRCWPSTPAVKRSWCGRRTTGSTNQRVSKWFHNGRWAQNVVLEQGHLSTTGSFTRSKASFCRQLGCPVWRATYWR